MREPESPVGDQQSDAAVAGAGVATGRAAARLRRRLAQRHRAHRRARQRSSMLKLLALGVVVAAVALAALAAYVYWGQEAPRRGVVEPAGTFVAPLARGAAAGGEACETA